MKITEYFSDHENHTDDRNHTQPLPGNLLLLLTVGLSMTVVMAVFDITFTLLQVGHTEVK